MKKGLKPSSNKISNGNWEEDEVIILN